MFVHFAVLALASALIMAGVWYRVAAIVFALSVTYVFLLDQARYLNHMYLICLVGFPADGCACRSRVVVESPREPRVQRARLVAVAPPRSLRDRLHLCWRRETEF